MVKNSDTKKSKHYLHLLILIGVPILVFTLAIYVSQIPNSDTSYGDVTVQQAKELIEKKSLVILDVRTDLEFNTGHINGAINILYNELELRLDEFNKSDEFLIYSRTGTRSFLATLILKNKGYSKVYNMVDGIEAWKKAGYPIVY